MCLFWNYHIHGWVGGPYNNLYGEALPKRISLSNGEALPKRIPLSIQNCTFSTFDMDKKAKETNGKNAFKLEILPSLQVGLLKTNEDIAPQWRQILQTFVWCGSGTNLLPPPPVPTLHVRTSVYFSTLLSYIFARLRRITFSFGTVTATEINIKLLLVLDMCQRPWQRKGSPSSTAVTLVRWLFAQKNNKVK